jgi:hypothetical protein
MCESSAITRCTDCKLSYAARAYYIISLREAISGAKLLIEARSCSASKCAKTTVLVVGATRLRSRLLQPVALRHIH